MKKLTRKKRHLGEYSKYGFDIDCEFTISPEEHKSKIDFIWNEILEFLDNNNYSCGGGSNRKTLGITIDGFREYSEQKFTPRLTNLDKEKIVEYFSRLPYLKITNVSGWINMYYPDDKQLNRYQG